MLSCYCLVSNLVRQISISFRLNILTTPGVSTQDQTAYMAYVIDHPNAFFGCWGIHILHSNYCPPPSEGRKAGDLER